MPKISSNLRKCASSVTERAKTTKKEKTRIIKWHNMIPCAFWKGSWIFQSATKGPLHILVLGWTRNGRSSFAFTTAAFAGSLQHLRGPAFLNPARYIFMAMYLWRSEGKIITALSDAINISESQGIKRLGAGADAGRAPGRGVQRPPQPGLQLRGIDTADGGTRLGRNSGHSSGIRNKLK